MREDWSAALPPVKQQVFDHLTRHWEASYHVLSIVLDGALDYRYQGKLVRARQAAKLASEAVHKLCAPLLGTYGALANRGRHLANPPLVSPLNPEFFCSEGAKKNAGWNQLLHKILLGGRARYLQKLRALELTVIYAAEEFQSIGADIAAGTTTTPEEAWTALDHLHFDLNTCLRETMVVFKSFLRVLPDCALGAAEKELTEAFSLVPAKRSKFPQPDRTVSV